MERLPMCENRPKVPSDEEEKILSRLRELKEKAKDAKNALKTSKDEGTRQKILVTLQGLKEDWEQLQRELEEARKRRMKLLGY